MRIRRNLRNRRNWRWDGSIRAAFLHEFVGTPLLGGSIDGNPMLTFMSSNATITPAITLSGDGPCQWEVTEVNGAKYYYNANSFSHTRSVAGNMIVRLLNTVQVAPYVTQIDFNSNGIISGYNSLVIKLFTNLTILRLYANQITGDLTGVTWQSSLSQINIRNNLLTGNISSMVYPQGLTQLYLLSNIFTGDLSSQILPSTLVVVQIYSNMFTGLPVPPNPTALQTFLGYNMGTTNMTQSRIDAFITAWYTKWVAGAFSANCTVNIGGTNADPSGIYQNPSPNPPATPLEMIYVMTNDPFVTGNKTQVWTY